MRRTIKSAIALLAVSALPLIAVAPASAASPDYSNVTWDCDDYTGDYDTYDIPLDSGGGTITLLNCETNNLWDWDDTGNASTNDGTLDDLGLLEVNEATEVITITGESSIEIWDNDSEANGSDIGFDFIAPYDMPDPSGTQLFDTSQTIAATNPAETTYGTAAEIAAGEEIGIGGDTEECGILPGRHVYATQEITVTKSGEYTFRVTGVDPASDYLSTFMTDANPLDDPMVALYSSFNPANPNSGNVGCNDDLNDLTLGGYDYGDNDFNTTQQGNLVEGHFSYFAENLTPGEYTLVFTTWEVITVSEWESGVASTDNSDYEWTPGVGTVFFDIWGPTGGLTLGHNLAATGVDPSFGLWAGLGLAATGVAITVARRRSQRVQ
ncbi:MAG: hypothetical protein RLZZ587_131 [Actinomycetota bacterium]